MIRLFRIPFLDLFCNNPGHACVVDEIKQRHTGSTDAFTTKKTTLKFFFKSGIFWMNIKRNFYTVRNGTDYWRMWWVISEGL